jgi:hypothetical protein
VPVQSPDPGPCIAGLELVLDALQMIDELLPDRVERAQVGVVLLAQDVAGKRGDGQLLPALPCQGKPRMCTPPSSSSRRRRAADMKCSPDIGPSQSARELAQQPGREAPVRLDL